MSGLKSDEEDVEENFENYKRNIGKSTYTIYPDARLKELWDWVMFLFIIYEIIAVPYYIAFEFFEERRVIHIEMCLEAFFIFDICKL